MCCIQGIQESNEDCLPCMVERPAAKDKTQRKSEVQPMQIRGDVKSNMLYPILLRFELCFCVQNMDIQKHPVVVCVCMLCALVEDGR